MPDFVRTLLRLVSTVGARFGVNAIPLLGVWGYGWSWENAISLYMVENFLMIGLATLFVGWFAPAVESPPGLRMRRRSEVLSTYLIVALTFALGSSLFLVLFLFVMPRKMPDLVTLRTALLGILPFLLLGFGYDLFTLRPLTLASAEKYLERSLGRVFLLFLAVFCGVWLAAVKQNWFLLPFAVLKTMVDVGERLRLPKQLGASQVKV